MIDWQQILSLFIVALAAFLLVRNGVRKRRRVALSACAEDCGCSGSELLKQIPADRLQQLRDERKRMNQ
jgi:hypothetical protein